MTDAVAQRIDHAVDADRLVELTRSLIAIPSPRFGEHEIATYLAGYLRGLGAEVELQPVPFPGGTTLQVIARFAGSGGGRTLLLNGHLDSAVSRADARDAFVPAGSGNGAVWQYYRAEDWTRDPFGGEIEDGWIYGIGACDMKGGIAAIVSVADTLSRAGVRLAGDLVIACTSGEFAAGLGAKHALDCGLTADVAVIAESIDLDIGTVAVGGLLGRITVHGESKILHEHANPIVKMSRLIDALGGSHETIEPGDWLTFAPHPGLPGFPRMAIRQIESAGDTCSILFDLRAVPGITDATLRDDLERVVHRLREADPEFRATLELPASPYVLNNPQPETPRDASIVRTLARCHERVTGVTPTIGAGSRLGGASDASYFKAAGIAETVEYGPGLLDPWPAVDERCRVEDIVTAARVLALTAAETCGQDIN